MYRSRDGVVSIPRGARIYTNERDTRVGAERNAARTASKTSAFQLPAALTLCFARTCVNLR
jgi:hypothetical protein